MEEIEKKDFAKYRLNRAKEDLSTAILLLENNKIKDSNNRSYYAVFHAIKAVLALEEKDFKRHKDVLAYFNMNYVKPEIFPRNIGKRIKKCSVIREASDYEDFYIAVREEAEEQIETAKILIELIEKYINKK